MLKINKKWPYRMGHTLLIALCSLFPGPSRAYMGPQTSYEGILFSIERALHLITSDANDGTLSQETAIAIAFGKTLAEAAQYVVNLPLFAHLVSHQDLKELEWATMEGVFYHLVDVAENQLGDPLNLENIWLLYHHELEAAASLGIDGYLKKLLDNNPCYFGQEQDYQQTLFGPPHLLGNTP